MKTTRDWDSVRNGHLLRVTVAMRCEDMWKSALGCQEIADRGTEPGDWWSKAAQKTRTDATDLEGVYDDLWVTGPYEHAGWKRAFPEGNHGA